MMVQRNIHFHTFKIYNSSHRLILNLRTYRTASLSHELLLIIAFGELLIKKVHARFLPEDGCSGVQDRKYQNAATRSSR